MNYLYFIYSTMNAGKTTLLLQHNYMYREKKIKTLLLIPKIANKKGLIISRIGLKKKAKIIDEKTNIFKYIRKKNIKILLIDEAQFLSKKNIYELVAIVDILKITVIAYGLKTDFKSKLFTGSKYLIELADKIIELKTICSKCFRKAILNIKIKNNKKITKGSQIEIKKNLYLPVCRYHYYKFNEKS